MKSDEEWRKQLTPEQFHVARQHGTERPFSSPLNSEKRPGMFNCVCCGAPLFSSSAKFDSGTGWSSFSAPASDGTVSENEDRSWLMRRTEVRCAACDGSAELCAWCDDGENDGGAEQLVTAARNWPAPAPRNECLPPDYELLSMCARNSAMEPNRTRPLGSSASIDPSA